MKPYHTPKSERDEAVGALTEAEAVAAINEAPAPELRFSGEFMGEDDACLGGYDFKATSEAQAIEKMNVEALLPAPEFSGPIHSMMLYCYDTPGGWIELEVL
jgi:hypothetical protein